MHLCYYHSALLQFIVFSFGFMLCFILFIKELQYVDLFMLSTCFSFDLYILSRIMNVRIYLCLVLVFPPSDAK
jgi:hypothetical protein